MRNTIDYFLIITVIFVFSLNVLLAQSSVKENKTLPGGFVKSTILKKNSSHSSSIYKDDMNGDNSIAGLESRGWVIVDADSGGDNPAWFQGDSANTFAAYEGPNNGYVASDYDGANLTTNILDHWLISPQITVSDNDTISFWMQSPSNTGFDDSISVYLSPDGGSNLTDFSLAYDDGSNTQRYLVPQGAWSNWRGLVPAGNIRFAIRYHTADASSYSWYIGVDLIEVLSSSIIIVFNPSVTTGAASSITSSSAILNGTINPNGATTAYTFEYGTTTSYGNVSSGTQELTGSNDQDVNATITGLASNTLYHYRLTATTIWGTTNGDDVTFTTTTDNATADLVLKTLAIPSFSWQSGDNITAELNVINSGTSTAASHQTQLYISVDQIINNADTPIGNPISFNSLAPGESQTLSESFTVPSIAKGLYYIAALLDINNDVAESDESNGYYRTSKIIIGYPTAIQVNTTYSFSDYNLKSSYRLVGIPGGESVPLSQLLSGTPKEDWIAYYDNGNTNDYLVAYDGTPQFNFAPGKGFWLLSKNSLTMNKSITPVQLQSKTGNTSSTEIVASISLHNGWNIISNPFETSVDWNQVKLFNGISEDIHAFNGSFSTSTDLETYKGYYFFNATNLSTLSLPYKVSSALPKAIVKENEKGLTISIVDENKIRSSISIGFNSEALVSYDKYDKFAPPGDFEEYKLSIYNEKLETGYKYLLNDERDNLNNQIYDIEIKSPTNKYFELIIDRVNKVKDALVYLVDQNHNFHNLKIEKNIILKTSAKKSKLQLLIGDENFIETQKQNLLPDEFILSQNYPNPFNPTTTIKYSIPSSVGLNSFQHPNSSEIPKHISTSSVSVRNDNINVTLKVYDVLGREVVTLVNGRQKPGFYELAFDAANLTSGVYFYRLTAGASTGSATNFNETRKMILLR